MKKFTTLLLIAFFSTVALAQKKNKIKGSRKVTTEQKQIRDFKTIEVADNIEVHLEKGEKPFIKIEADDNLHDIITVDLRDNTLHLFTSKEATRFRKLMVKITYTSALKNIISTNEAEINAIQAIITDSLNVKSLDNSKVYMNAVTEAFTLEADDKSKIELNLKSQKAKIVLSKDASLKTLVSSTDLTCDLYQKAEARVEGDAVNAVIRLDHNAKLTADKLLVKNMAITTESYSTAMVNAETSVIIEAADKSEIQLFGNAKIDLRKLTDEAKLLKKIK
ncbi:MULTISPECIES: GIN domain-containing protein [unclassified Flavobacterium]|uniref:GIN domain-containing protein n=1 Tax=unclassified Flavobacterium TaxID=196869 RepID=UPI003F8E1995